MARPVINTTSSVLGFRQWEDFAFQPTALNTPTGWTSSALPQGVTLNASTGLIEGPAERPGVYVVQLYASNADGTSNPIILTFGIQASVNDPTSTVTELYYDIATGVVVGYLPDEDLLFRAKEGDGRVFRVHLVKGGIPCGLDCSVVGITAKQFDTDGIVVQSDGFVEEGSGLGVFLVHIEFDGSALEGALSDAEEDSGTQFEALCEIEILFTNDTGLGPSDLRQTSLTFKGMITRDLGEHSP
jgi:hypothetical protein